MSPAERQAARARWWRVRRVIVEEYDVQAETRTEALDMAEDPHTVRIVKETCRPLALARWRAAKEGR